MSNVQRIERTEAEKADRRRLTKFLGGAILAVVVIGGLASGSSHQSYSASTSTSTVSLGSQHDHAVKWVQVMMPELKATANSMRDLGCEGGNVRQCGAGLAQMGANVKHALQVMDASPAPSCLNGMESKLRFALQTADEAADISQEAISTANVVLMQRAVNKMAIVPAAINAASAQFIVEAPNCSENG